MSTNEFSVNCHNCKKEVNGFSQNIEYTMTRNSAVQGAQTLQLSCGCVVDFPDWKINLDTGWCQIYNYAGILFIEFLDEDMVYEEGDDDL